MATQEKQILTRGKGIQKEIMLYLHIFRGNQETTISLKICKIRKDI